MSVGSSIEQGTQALQGVRRVNEELGVKTFAAVSNVSFGLPNRQLLNRTFLAMLIEAGLDGAIMDPTDSGMMNTVYASRALLGRDNYCMQYIKQQKRRRRK
jgi:5-methyltetrahydrofolate--homocysteine methyltransferase